MKHYLFTPYFKAKTPERQKEFVLCLQKNIECAQFEKIFLLVDDGHVPEVESKLIEVIAIEGRPTYAQWLDLTAQRSSDGVSVLANTDIYFTNTLGSVDEIFTKQPRAFIALSRYEKIGDEQILHKNPHWSQDVWMVGPEVSVSAELRKEVDIPLGVPRCDNKIAYLFSLRGHVIYNPCYDVRSVHVHETQQRTYDKLGDETVLGGTAWVYPGGTLLEPAKLQIDIWTKNSAQVIGQKMNKTWDGGNPIPPVDKKTAEKVNSARKNIIGVDIEWQYPAITEKHAYDMMCRLASESGLDGVVYFGFPWASLMDQSLHNKKNPEIKERLERELHLAKPALAGRGSVVTVCQHIHMLKFQSLFKDMGITDIFWSHAAKGQPSLPEFPEVKIHPFPLFPVQAVGCNGFKESDGKYIYSFVGARARPFYLSQARNWIIDSLADDKSALVIGRESWHYNKVVYDHQIRGVASADAQLVDEQASDEFRSIMRDSTFSLCPSGSGPNSIRLWESMGFGVIPVILADTHLLPGDLALWEAAAIFCNETPEAVKQLPDLLRSAMKSPGATAARRLAVKQLWLKYGPDCFVYDVLKLVMERAKPLSSERASAKVQLNTGESLRKILNAEPTGGLLAQAVLSRLLIDRRATVDLLKSDATVRRQLDMAIEGLGDDDRERGRRILALCGMNF